MEREVYRKMAATEKKHWWFVGRRKIIYHFLKRLHLPKESAILEAGCGCGGNLELLSQFGRVWAFEPDREALIWAKTHAPHGVSLEYGTLPEGIPFEKQSFQLIALFDVLEHIPNDKAALRALSARLLPNGKVLLTVPAHPWLWGPHDAYHHHQRRYSKGALRELLKSAGLEIEFLSYYNSYLFPLALLRRLTQVFVEHSSADLDIPPFFINSLFSKVFGGERHFIKKIPFITGLSLIALASHSSRSTSK